MPWGIAKTSLRLVSTKRAFIADCDGAEVEGGVSGICHTYIPKRYNKNYKVGVGGGRYKMGEGGGGGGGR